MRRHLLVFMSLLWLAGCGSSGRDGIEVGQPGSVDIVDEVSADIESLAHQPVAESHEPAKVPRLTGPARPGRWRAPRALIGEEHGCRGLPCDRRCMNDDE